MTSASGIWNHANPANSRAATSLLPVRPNAADTGSAGSAASDGSTISANDFLTLLVTEMQNQDPTANTDPNEYVNQLVQVNSLEQLININQTLSTDLGSTGAPATGGAQSSPTAGVAQASPINSPSPAPVTENRNANPAGASAPSALTGLAGLAMPTTAGNLSVPGSNPAAERVGHALSRRAQID